MVWSYNGNKNEFQPNGVLIPRSFTKLACKREHNNTAVTNSETKIFCTQYVKYSLAAPPAFSTEAHKDEIIIKEGESVIHEVPFCGNPQPKVDWDYNRVRILRLDLANFPSFKLYQETRVKHSCHYFINIQMLCVCFQTIILSILVRNRTLV